MIAKLFRMATQGPSAMVDVLSSAADLARVEGQILAKTLDLDIKRIINVLIWAVVTITALVIALILLASALILGIYALYPTLPLWVAPLLLCAVFFGLGSLAWINLRQNLDKVGLSLDRLKEVTSQIYNGEEDEFLSIEQQQLPVSR